MCGLLNKFMNLWPRHIYSQGEEQLGQSVWEGGTSQAPKREGWWGWRRGERSFYSGTKDNVHTCRLVWTFWCPALRTHRYGICDDFSLAGRVGPDLHPTHYWETSLNCPFKHTIRCKFVCLSNKNKKKDAKQHERTRHFARHSAYP